MGSFSWAPCSRSSASSTLRDRRAYSAHGHARYRRRLGAHGCEARISQGFMAFLEERQGKIRENKELAQRREAELRMKQDVERKKQEMTHAALCMDERGIPRGCCRKCGELCPAFALRGRSLIRLTPDDDESDDDDEESETDEESGDVGPQTVSSSECCE